MNSSHGLLGILLCYATCIIICTSSLPLIGSLHGPSDERIATKRQALMQSQFLAMTNRDGAISWPWDDIGTAEAVLAMYEEVAYQDDRAAILRDAGAVAALFALLLAMFPNFTTNSYSTSQRLYFAMLALPMYIASSQVGQIVFEKTNPIEIEMGQTWGMAKAMAFALYCSGQSLLTGIGGELLSSVSLMHEAKVVVSAGALSFFILGLMPCSK